MKTLIASILALGLISATAANADVVGVGVHVGGVGVGAHVGGHSWHHSHCNSWGWRNHHHDHYCRSWHHW
jgi:hypothetical protein